MNFNSRLCNPSGEVVKINWHAGINIRIEPDDFIDLNYRQMEDFQDGKPGSEEMKETMNHYGIFIRDPDRNVIELDAYIGEEPDTRTDAGEEAIKGYKSHPA